MWRNLGNKEETSVNWGRLSKRKVSKYKIIKLAVLQLDTLSSVQLTVNSI